MTAREYAELCALAQEELLGLDREDFRSARQAAHVCGAMGANVKVSDLLPPRWNHEDEQTAEDMLSVLQGTLIPCNDPPVESVSWRK